jgi:hypothetical protein
MTIKEGTAEAATSEVPVMKKEAQVFFSGKNRNLSRNRELTLRYYVDYAM